MRWPATVALLLGATLLAPTASAKDICPITVDGESFVGAYTLALGDLSIEDLHSEPPLPSFAFFAGANKGAIRLPLTTESMDVRIIQGSGGQLYLGDGYQDAPLTVHYESDIYLNQNVKKFLLDLEVEQERLRAAKGLLTTDGATHDGYKSVTTAEDYHLACAPPRPTTITVSGETEAVIFSYGLAVLSHSKDSTLMLGRLNWIGVNGVRATRQVIMMRGQFANMDYWFKNYHPAQ